MPSPAAGCDEMREWLGAYLIGALEPEEDAMVRAHLARCSTCRSESDDLADVVRLLRDALPLSAVGHGARHPATEGGARRTHEKVPVVDEAAPLRSGGRVGGRKGGRSEQGGLVGRARISPPYAARRSGTDETVAHLGVLAKGGTVNDQYGYGLWVLVVVDTLLLVAFAASFLRPRTARDWKALGGFSAFVVALFTEMYGFPLTVYLLAGPLGGWFPDLGFSHDQGHLWNDLIGWQGDPHLSPFHLAAYALIIVGFVLITAGWRHLRAAARLGWLATWDPYRYVRHPQYTGFLAIMAGFLFMWPTLPTLVMFPVLVWIYRRLAIREESEVAARFGVIWEEYGETAPRFLPSPRRRQPRSVERPRIGGR